MHVKLVGDLRHALIPASVRLKLLHGLKVEMAVGILGRHQFILMLIDFCVSDHEFICEQMLDRASVDVQALRSETLKYHGILNHSISC